MWDGVRGQYKAQWSGDDSAGGNPSLDASSLRSAQQSGQGCHVTGSRRGTGVRAGRGGEFSVGLSAKGTCTGWLSPQPRCSAPPRSVSGQKSTGGRMCLLKGNGPKAGYRPNKGGFCPRFWCSRHAHAHLCRACVQHFSVRCISRCSDGHRAEKGPGVGICEGRPGLQSSRTAAPTHPGGRRGSSTAPSLEPQTSSMTAGNRPAATQANKEGHLGSPPTAAQ